MRKCDSAVVMSENEKGIKAFGFTAQAHVEQHDESVAATESTATTHGKEVLQRTAVETGVRVRTIHGKGFTGTSLTIGENVDWQGDKKNGVRGACEREAFKKKGYASAHVIQCA